MPDTEKNAAAHRKGAPVPLPFYLSMTANIYAQAVATSGLEGAKHLALAQETAARLQDMLDGIAAWKTHPHRRYAPDHPILWQRGSTSLRDFGKVGDLPVLIIPSLINGPEILDLSPDRSFLASFTDAGLRPIVLDWGYPGRDDRSLSLSCYVSDRLLPALNWTTSELGDTALLGYCLGGPLAIAAAQLAERKPTRIALIGAPWDFSAIEGIAQALTASVQADGGEATRRSLQEMGKSLGAVPPDLFQSLFALLAPMQAARKFRRFAKMDQACPKAETFVAVEDWLNSGPAVAAPAAEELLVDWYALNAPAHGAWQCGGKVIDPGLVDVPTLAIVGKRDHIAPPKAACPLAKALPNATCVEGRSWPCGHDRRGARP